jgi:hypothetical protein
VKFSWTLEAAAWYWEQIFIYLIFSLSWSSLFYASFPSFYSILTCLHCPSLLLSSCFVFLFTFAVIPFAFYWTGTRSSYWGGVRFESRPDPRLLWLKFSWLTSASAGKHRDSALIGPRLLPFKCFAKYHSCNIHSFDVIIERPKASLHSPQIDTALLLLLFLLL